jgi:hypothetical protein
MESLGDHTTSLDACCGSRKPSRNERTPFGHSGRSPASTLGAFRFSVLQLKLRDDLAER